jgi:hypothetical protein
MGGRKLSINIRKLVRITVLISQIMVYSYNYKEEKLKKIT